MGFTVYYQSTTAIPPITRLAVSATAGEMCEGYTWLTCDPVSFFLTDGTGHMIGGVKSKFRRHPDDIAEETSENLPNGTITDALDILCELSRQFDIEWEFSHDHKPDPIGTIRHGYVDQELQNRIEGIAHATQIFASIDGDQDYDGQPTAPEKADDEDDGPRILKFGPVDKS